MSIKVFTSNDKQALKLNILSDFSFWLVMGIKIFFSINWIDIKNVIFEVVQDIKE